MTTDPHPPLDPAFYVDDCMHLSFKDDTFDLVFGSPPYEDARTYGIDFKHKGEAWVEWALPRFEECLRVCRGVVAWVVRGKQKNYAYSATPERLMVALQDRGYTLRRPLFYHRHGIPGSGGPDWFANKVETIVCATRHPGKLPWSNNSACGEPPKYGPGGAMSHRLPNGERKHNPERRKDGGKTKDQTYRPPAKSNPGNVIDCGAVGGGHIGSKLAHENEAPFPEKLAEFAIKSLCPPGGCVLDPFSGSGTTVCAAYKLGRHSVGVDIREGQNEIARRRLAEAKGAAV